MDYGQPVRFGVFVTPVATEDPMRQAIAADELGFDVIGIQDHPYQRRFFDTWTLLTAIAMRTARIGLFPDVANVPLRPPAMLAKAAATLDILSATGAWSWAWAREASGRGSRPTTGRCGRPESPCRRSRVRSR